MKKTAIALVVLSLFIFTSAVASAKHNWHGHNQPYERDSHWKHHSSGRHYEQSMPFRWHDHRNAFHRQNHRIVRIYDQGWQHRFPDLHAYRWHGHNGFWHDGHYVDDAILFFDGDDELAAFGYFRGERFLMVRYDDEEYESDDSFFFSWWSRHGGVVIRH